MYWFLFDRGLRDERVNPYSPMMELFYKILVSEELFNKMNIFGFTFEKKHQIWSKNPKISFLQLKLTLAEGGYRFKKKTTTTNKQSV